MKFDDAILEKMIKSIKTSLPSFHSHRKKARRYAKAFLLAYDDKDKEFIIKEILHQQNRSIIKAIEEKKNIAIPFLGSFQYRESLELIREIKNEVKKEMQIDDLRKVDEFTFLKANEEIERRKKGVLIPLYFKQLDIKGSTVNHNFRNK